MQKRKNATHSRRFIGASAVIICALILSAISGHVPVVSAQFTPQITISPTIVPKLTVGQSFIMTVNLTDFPNPPGLYLFQVVLKYDGSVLNLTSNNVNVAGNVFSGHTAVIDAPEPTDTEAVGDTTDHLNWTMVGASLRGDDSAAVTNGVLTELNFTAVGTGTTTVVLETLTSPAHHYTDTYYSLLMDSNFIEYDNFAPIGCTVLVGVSRAPPIAVFTITSPPVNNVTELVLHQNIPGDVFLKGIPWARAYIGLPELFNASLSYAPTGNITAYIWDFGDGNTTVVNVTSPASALITHVYDNVTHYFVTLTVVASVSGSPSMSSQPAVYAVLVDLALPYYNWDWFIYTVFGLIVAAIVISATRSAFRRVRRRNALKKQKMLTAGPSSRPPTSAKPT